MTSPLELEWGCVCGMYVMCGDWDVIIARGVIILCMVAMDVLYDALFVYYYN